MRGAAPPIWEVRADTSHLTRTPAARREDQALTHPLICPALCKGWIKRALNILGWNKWNLTKSRKSTIFLFTPALSLLAPTTFIWPTVARVTPLGQRSPIRARMANIELLQEKTTLLWDAFLWLKQKIFYECLNVCLHPVCGPVLQTFNSGRTAGWALLSWRMPSQHRFKQIWIS